MNKNSLFQKYRSKLVLEGILKAAIWGFVAFCLVVAVVAFVGWATGYNSAVWLGIVIGVAVGILCAVILYFALFRPTAKLIAQRLDALGLEERMITMMELQKDDSYIAMRQREDAKAQLAKVNPKQISVAPFAANAAQTGSKSRAAMLGCVIAAPILAIAMELLLVLSIYSVLPGGNDVFDPSAQPSFVLVSYMDNDGGTIQGETDQIVEVGGSTEAVLAVADDGFAFVQWSDGYAQPSRSDSNVQEDLFVYPEFQEAGDDGDGDPGDEPSDQPSDQPNEGDGSGNGDPSQDPGNQGGLNGEDNSTIIDGNTDYKDEYEYYYELAMQLLNSGTLTPEMEAFLKAYFDSLL